jgi:DNA polymerase V
MTGCCSDVTEPFALRVVGDSMAPEFQDGNIIIIDPGYPAVHGAFVVVDYGGEVIFARYAEEDGRRWLQFLNGDRPVELIPPYEVKGVVVQRAGRRRKDRKHYAYPQRADLSASV